MYRTVKPALVVTVLVVAAGCGGGASADPSPTPSVEISLPPAASTSPVASPSSVTSSAPSSSASGSVGSPSSVVTPTPSKPASLPEADGAAALKALDSFAAEKVKLTSDPKRSTETISTLTTGEAKRITLASVAKLREGKLRTAGNVTWASRNVVSASRSNGLDVVKIHACEDVSKLRVLDAKGKDVTPPSRPDRSQVDYLVARKAQSSDSWLVHDVTAELKPC